ncbi:MAG TPA: DUF3551 domain-containing protein [Pseudolabrys sp.]
MRILLIAGAVLAVMSLDAKSAKAAEGPWCAFIAVAQGAVYEDCQYYSFEACRSVVLAGNRGFCNQNPRWAGPIPGAKRARHRRHVHHY